MKTKGISVIERHGEKAVVGVFALLALGVVAWQFVGAGNRVTIENNQKVEPDRAYESITRKAQQIAGQLADPNPVAGIPETAPDIASKIRTRLNDGLARADAPLPVAMGLSVNEEQVAIPEDARFAAVGVPGLTGVAAAQYLVTLNPLAVADSEGLAAVAPQSQPYDLRAVSVQATFPAGAFRANLEADPDGSGPLSPLPRTFWLNRTAILDVRLERQRVNADGTTGPVERVPASPRAESFAGAMSPGMSPGEFQTTTREARVQLASVVQPPFPPTIAGDVWAPPAQASATGGAAQANPEIATLNAQLDRVEREIADQQARLENATSEQAKTNINNRIAALTAEKDRLGARIIDLDAQTSSANEGATASTLPEPRNIESGQDIIVVAHDLTGAPGETYRYRLSVGVANPLFPWAANLQEDQRSLAESPVLYSSASEWSQPISVAPKAQVFFTRASAGQGADAVGGFRVGDASAEVFGLYYGHWRGSGSRLAPGDTLSATIALPEGLKLFDIAKPEGGPPEVAGEQPAPAQFTVALDGAMLVDVIQKSAGAARPDYLAVVRMPDGRLALRDPDRDSRDPALAAAQRSAAAGATALPENPTPGASTGRTPAAPRRQPAARQPAPSPSSSGPSRPQGRTD